MKKHELFSKLLKVKENVQIIKDCDDNLDKVVSAQYGIQDIMTEIVDDLLICLFQTNSNEKSKITDEKSKITDEVCASYVDGEDKTIVWHNLYADGELISSQLVGWYCGEPVAEFTDSYSKCNNTAYYFD